MERSASSTSLLPLRTYLPVVTRQPGFRPEYEIIEPSLLAGEYHKVRLLKQAIPSDSAVSS